jgi:hypothetical protein
VRKEYQRQDRNSNHKLEVVRRQESLVQVPLPIVEVWSELQAQVEELTGKPAADSARHPGKRSHAPGRTSPSAASRRRLCALGEAAGLCGFLVDRKSRWNGHGYERGKARKWSWRATVSCSKTESCNGGAETHGGRVVHAELSVSGSECSGRLRD